MKKKKIYRRFIRPIKHLLGYVLIQLTIIKLNLFPRKIALLFASIAGRIAYSVLLKERAIALSNLALALPQTAESERLKIAKNCFRQTAMSLVDIARARRIVHSKPRVWKVVGIEHLNNYIAKYGGGIVITGHIGPFELIPGIFAELGFKVAAVGRKLYDEKVDKLLVHQREKMGIVNIPSDASAKKIVRLVHEGYIIGILMDTWTSSVEGISAPFFGIETRTISGAVQLARFLQIPLLPMAIYRDDENNIILEVFPILELTYSENKVADIANGVTHANRAIEDMILRAPEQWIWHHNRFREQSEYPAR